MISHGLQTIWWSLWGIFNILRKMWNSQWWNITVNDILIAFLLVLGYNPTLSTKVGIKLKNLLKIQLPFDFYAFTSRCLWIKIVLLQSRAVVAYECLFSDLRYICNTCMQVADRYITLTLRKWSKISWISIYKKVCQNFFWHTFLNFIISLLKINRKVFVYFGEAIYFVVSINVTFSLLLFPAPIYLSFLLLWLDISEPDFRFQTRTYSYRTADHKCISCFYFRTPSDHGGTIGRFDIFPFSFAYG